MMDLSIKIQRGEDYVFNEVDGELVMMNIETGSYATLNETGKSIWVLLEEPNSVENIMKELANEFDATSEQIQKDILPFLKKLFDQKIIVKA